MLFDFPDPRRVLDEVAVTWPVDARGGFEPADRVELVVAREDDLLFVDLLAGAKLLFLRQVEEAPDDVEERVALPDLFPEVGGAIAARVLGVASAPMRAPVERQERRALAAKERGHVREVGIHREVDQRAALELEEPMPRIASPVLCDRVLHGLVGERVLQLDGRDRQPVER